MMSHDRVHSTLKTANLLKKDENGGDALSSVKASTILEENVEGLIRSSIAASRRGGCDLQNQMRKTNTQRTLPWRTHINLNEFDSGYEP